MKKLLLFATILLAVLFFSATDIGGQQGVPVTSVCILNQPNVYVEIGRLETDSTYHIVGRLSACNDSLPVLTAVSIQIQDEKSTSTTYELSFYKRVYNADSSCVADLFRVQIHGGLLRRALSYPCAVQLTAENGQAVRITLLDPKVRSLIAQKLGFVKLVEVDTTR